MKTFNGVKKLKTDLLKEIKKHEKADEIAQGNYESMDASGKLRLCAVGCALYSLNAVKGKKIETSDHGAFEPELGIPRIIARLTDRIFEGLELEEAKKFPYEFIEAIPVGADLSLIWSKYVHWLLVGEGFGVIKFAAKYPKIKEAIQCVANLYLKKINGETVETEEWRNARKHAYAYVAAYVVAYADAAVADAAVADAAVAYAAVAYADARRLAFKIQKEKLLELLREAK